MPSKQKDRIGSKTAHALSMPVEGEPRYSVIVITPGLAQQFIAIAREGAKPNHAAIHNYAASMREGWILNGMPIIIGSNGLMLDGFQRCHAAIAANRSFITLLAENVDPSVLHTIDQQRRRSYVAVLEGRGYKNARQLAGTLSRLIRYYTDTLNKPYQTIPWLQMDALLANNPTITDSVDYACATPNMHIADTLRSALTHLALKKNKSALNRLWNATLHPEHFERTEPGVTIANKLIAERSASYRTSPNELFALLILALNDTIAGKQAPATGYKYKNTDPYPQLTGATAPHQPPKSRIGHPTPVPQQSADSTQLTVATEVITPALAALYLNHNAGNRSIVQAHIATMVRDIHDGNWRLNATPIIFSVTGRLLNGQHRLHACIESDTPIIVTVVRGIADEAFATYDLQAKRPLDTSDLALPHASDERVVVAAAKLLDSEIRLAELQAANDDDAGAAAIVPPPPPPRLRYSNSEIAAILQRHKTLPTHCTYGRRAAHVAPASIMTYISYAVSADSIDDKQLGEAFLTKLETGAEIPLKSPLLKLRNQLMIARHTNKHDPHTVAVMIMNEWHRYKDAGHDSGEQ